MKAIKTLEAEIELVKKQPSFEAIQRLRSMLLGFHSRLSIKQYNYFKKKIDLVSALFRIGQVLDWCEKTTERIQQGKINRATNSIFWATHNCRLAMQSVMPEQRAFLDNEIVNLGLSVQSSLQKNQEINQEVEHLLKEILLIENPFNEKSVLRLALVYIKLQYLKSCYKVTILGS